jgi:uncharacterized membrane-anchored protein
MYMKESGWRLLGSGLAILGVIFVVGALTAYVNKLQQYEAVLSVFGGIFLVIGAGLVVVTYFEKDIEEEKD